MVNDNDILSLRHKLNNPLGIIKMICEYHLDEMKEKNAIDKKLLKGDLLKIINHVERLIKITADLKNHGK